MTEPVDIPRVGDCGVMIDPGEKNVVDPYEWGCDPLDRS